MNKTNCRRLIEASKFQRKFSPNFRKRKPYTSLFAFILIISINSHAQDYNEIRVKLENIVAENAAIRSSVMPTVKKYGFGSKQMDSLNFKILSQDSVHFKYVVELIEQYGWIGKSKVGSLANSALFITIQHTQSDSVLSKYYPLLEASAQSGESSLAYMATMKDRILLHQDKPQLYATQWKYDNGNSILYPIADIKKVNKRRKKVGLRKLDKVDINASMK